MRCRSSNLSPHDHPRIRMLMVLQKPRDGEDGNLGLSYADNALSITAKKRLFEPHSLKFNVDLNGFPSNFTNDQIVIEISAEDTCATEASQDSRRFKFDEGTTTVTLNPDDDFKIHKIYDMKVSLGPYVPWWLEEIIVKEWDEMPGCYPCSVDRSLRCEWPLVER